MRRLKSWIAQVRAWLEALEEQGQRAATVPFADRRADDIAAWKVVRDALLVQ